MKALADAAKYPLAVELLAYRGMRWGEFAALSPRYVPFDRSRISMVRNAVAVVSEAIAGDTKAKERRTAASLAVQAGASVLAVQ